LTFLFAALGVADIAASAAWYERLLGRAPDLVPNKRERRGSSPTRAGSTSSPATSGRAIRS